MNSSTHFTGCSKARSDRLMNILLILVRLL